MIVSVVRIGGKARHKKELRQRDSGSEAAREHSGRPLGVSEFRLRAAEAPVRSLFTIERLG